MRYRALAVLALVLQAAPLAAKPKPAPTAPGTYTDWQDEIDKLEIVASFELGDYRRAVVEPFDTSETPLPEADDNTYAPVKETLPRAAAPFAAQLGESLRGRLAVTEGTAGDGALVVRGRVAVMDPGSRAARYWGGFGAGAARTQLVLEVVDGDSGKVLLRIDQERRSGIGAAGGDYVKLMERNLRKLGEDVALVLAAF